MLYLTQVGRSGRAKRNPTSFALLISHLMIEYNLFVCSPIAMINTLLHITLKRGMRPCNGGLHQTMLYGIIMDIVDMPDKIMVTSDLVFPKTLLPDSLFTSLQVSSRLPAFEFIAASSAEITFDLPPAHRKIVIIFRQGPNTMQMFGQHHKGVNSKGVLHDDILKGFSHQYNVRFMTENSASVVRYDRKKERCPFCQRSPVLHDSSTGSSIIAIVSGFAEFIPQCGTLPDLPTNGRRPRRACGYH